MRSLERGHEEIRGKAPVTVTEMTARQESEN